LAIDPRSAYGDTKELDGMGLLDIGHGQSVHHFHLWRYLRTSSLQFKPNIVHHDGPRLPPRPLSNFQSAYTLQLSIPRFNRLRMERARIHDEHPRDDYHSWNHNDEYRKNRHWRAWVTQREPGYGHLSGMTKYIRMVRNNAHILVLFLLFFSGNIASGIGVFDVLHIISTFATLRVQPFNGW
jgi:hypothetical protein